MKTKYFLMSRHPNLILLGLLATFATACGTYQSSTADSDGIYGATTTRQAYNESSNSLNLQYQDYFSSFTSEQTEAETFTDIDSYQSRATEQEYATGNAGWGSNSENITVNIYDNNWGYGAWNNYWYGSHWGWNTSWGWSPWYGPGWGMGYNNWFYPSYGYGWYGGYSPYYGYPSFYHNNYYYNNNYYSHNNGIRGVRNDMYGRSASNSRVVTPPSRTSNTAVRTPIRTQRTDNTVRPNRSVQPTRTYNPNSNSRATAPATRSTTPVRTAPSRQENYSTPNQTQRQAPARNYNTAPTRSNSTPMMQSGGGGRSSGNMGGSTRSSSSGGRR